MRLAGQQRSLFFALLALSALLVVPFLLRPVEAEQEEAEETVVVLTPHNEAIRFEFARGFREYMRVKHNRNVRVDWRNPGGTAEIARYLDAEYRAAFQLHWEKDGRRSFDESIAHAFDNPKQSTEGETPGASARRAFLASSVGIRVDVLFGGGSFDFAQHAEAGRLVDSGFVREHPELFNETVIPDVVGGEPYWDEQGRWIGAAVSGFGICYSPDTLDRLGIQEPPRRWSDLARPEYRGHIALADPSKSGSATKAFEMLLQQTMAEGLAKQDASRLDEAAALARGFDEGLVLIRKIAGNSRYFTDSANKIPQDVAGGSAAAGTCIDFYGRFQSEASGGARRLTFVLPENGSSLGSDPIGLLRGAPHPDLGRLFITYVMSPAGQALWGLKQGVPEGPVRYALRRLPILPQLYSEEYASRRSDPDDNPYKTARSFQFHARWTGPLFRAIAFSVRVMCVDTESELQRAWAALVENGFPPRALARFEEATVLSHERIRAQVALTLALGEPLAEVALGNQLVREFKAQYEDVIRLAGARK